MRQGQGPNPKRLRGRGNGRKNTNSRPQHIDSNGPDVKVRGNAQQVVEKYLQLGRDATLSGDRITAESYFQHAEHYYRLMNTGNSNGIGVSNGYEARESNGAHRDGEVQEQEQREAPGAGPQPSVGQQPDETSASSGPESDDDQEPASA